MQGGREIMKHDSEDRHSSPWGLYVVPLVTTQKYSPMHLDSAIKKLKRCPSLRCSGYVLYFWKTKAHYNFSKKNLPFITVLSVTHTFPIVYNSFVICFPVYSHGSQTDSTLYVFRPKLCIHVLFLTIRLHVPIMRSLVKWKCKWFPVESEIYETLCYAILIQSWYINSSYFIRTQDYI
jgi:hypothetical protein